MYYPIYRIRLLRKDLPMNSTFVLTPCIWKVNKNTLSLLAKGQTKLPIDYCCVGL